MFERMVTIIGNVKISTVKPYSELAWYGNYETAIIHDNGRINILKGYDTYKEAVEGHCKYSLMTEEELINLPTIG